MEEPLHKLLYDNSSPFYDRFETVLRENSEFYKYEVIVG